LNSLKNEHEEEEVRKVDGGMEEMGKVVLDDGVGGMSALLVGILRMKEDGIV